MSINHASKFSSNSASLATVFAADHPAKRLANAVTTTIEDGINNALSLTLDPKVMAMVSGVSIPQFHKVRKPDTALILAGGRGTRMGNLTEDTPKPLIKVNGKPLIEYTLDLMDAAGIGRYVLNTDYLAAQMQEFARDRQGSVWKACGSRLLTVKQGELGPPSKQSFWTALNTVRKPFLISNGDTILLPKNISDINPISKLMLEWASTQADITMLVTHKDNAVGLDKPADYKFENGNLTWCKPSDGLADHVYTGIAVASPKFIRRLLVAKFSSKVMDNTDQAGSKVDSDAMHQLLGTMRNPETDQLTGFRAVVHDGQLYDVASPSMVTQAEQGLTLYKSEPA